MPAVIKPRRFYFAPDDAIPNNPKLPALLYRSILSPRHHRKAEAFARRFHDHGWRGVWRDGIYDYHHFHSNAHEVLAIARGEARVMLGGASGRVFRVKAGDMLVLPAGTGHKSLDASADFLVVGAYPKGQEDYDICRSLRICKRASMRIAATALPEADPFYGSHGPLPKYWMPKSRS